MRTSEPDEQGPLDRTRPAAELEDAVPPGLRFERAGDIARPNPRWPRFASDTRRTFAAVQFLDDDAIRRKGSERPMRRDAIPTVPIHHRRRPTIRLNAPRPQDTGTRLRRSRADVPVGRRAEVGRLDGKTSAAAAGGKQAQRKCGQGEPGHASFTREPSPGVPRIKRSRYPPDSDQAAPPPRRAAATRASSADTSSACRAARACWAARPSG